MNAMPIVFSRDTRYICKVMDLSQRKEQYSNAFLRTITSVAGYTLAKPDVDDDSVDWTIMSRSTTGLPRRPRLEVQLKCSARDIVHAENVHFPLDIKNYNDLRDENVLVPRMLIVVTVPNETSDWIQQSETEMVVKHCGYWMSLRSFPDVTNTDNITVKLPRKQLFTPNSLQDIMFRINAGGMP